jgi:hypothetical protein
MTSPTESKWAEITRELDRLYTIEEKFDTAIATLRRVYKDTEWKESDFADDGLAWQINGVLKAASIPAKRPCPACNGATIPGGAVAHTCDPAKRCALEVPHPAHKWDMGPNGAGSCPGLERS